jgi:hypothetical protein
MMMGDLIVVMIQQYGWWTIGAGILIYLLVESLLDVISGLIGDWIRAKLKKARPE